jgi:hypothetical protein
MNEFPPKLKNVCSAIPRILIAAFSLALSATGSFAQQAAPAAQPSQPQPAQPRAKSSAKTGCAPSFPQKPLANGTRVLIFTSPDDFQGAQVYLAGKCQGLIRQEAPNRNAYSLMVGNVPPGKYAVLIRMKGYQDFRTNVDVVASSLPPEKTPKVPVKFQLQPKTN